MSRGDSDTAAKATSPPGRGGFRFYMTTTVLIAFMGALAYKTGVDRINALSDRIDAARAQSREKMDEFVSSLTVDSVSVRSASDDEFLQGAITYAKDDFDTFNISFAVPVFIDVRGKGTGTVLGVKVRFDDKLMKLFATYANGVDNHRVYDLYRNGVYFNLDKPVQIAQGLSFQYTPNYSFHRTTCADVRKLIADVAGKLYEVEVQPFIANARDAAEPKTFRVTFAEDSLYQCE